jgi:uncharacterized paraquat-inducible protein A
MCNATESAQTIVRCGRCGVVLNQDELDAQRYPDRPRCDACDCTTGTRSFLRCSAIHAGSDDDAHKEWVRRVHLNTRRFDTPYG